MGPTEAHASQGRHGGEREVMNHQRTRARWIASAVMVVVALAAGRALAPAVARIGTPPSPSSPPARPPSSPTYPASWSRYSPADGSFHLMAPGAPMEQQGQTNAGLLHRAGFSVPGDGAWFVEWLDVSPEVAAGRSEADLIDLVLAPMADRLGAEIDEEDILRDGQYPGVELHLSATDGRAYLIRVFSANGRLVEATAEVGPGTSRADAQRFVESLELDLP